MIRKPIHPNSNGKDYPACNNWRLRDHITTCNSQDSAENTVTASRNNYSNMHYEDKIGILGKKGTLLFMEHCNNMKLKN